MRVVRVGPLPEAALEAAAEFHARVVAEVVSAPMPSDPPPVGEVAPRSGDGGVSTPAVTPLRQPSGLPPPLAGEDLVIVFLPALHDQRGWRLAAVQDLARAAAPARVNGVVGDDEQAIAETVAYLERSPGVTGQLLAVGPG